MFKKLILSILISQVLFLGAFWIANNEYYVVEEEKNLCWVFTRGNADYPNWLPVGWKAVYLYDELFTPFLENINCEAWYISSCCKENGYKYAWVPIGIEYISDERAWAEFLAAKWVINTKSFNPDEYKLDSYITRKEMMKIVMNLSSKTLWNECREVFVDVDNDWWCKYIESALDYGYITGNQAFRPNDMLTQTEALKLILQARNIWKRYDTWSWEEDYISTAYYLWYIDEKYSNYGIHATRGWIFSVAAKTYNDFSN